MELSNLDSLLEDQLKDLYSAENQLLKALPKMTRAASSPSLRQAFERHTEETRAQVDRLKEIGESLGITLGGKKCFGMEGLIKEGSEVFEMDGEAPLIDAALIAAAQRIEHYEISGYGTARAIAQRLGHSQAAETLQQTLDEESHTDELLTRISVDELLPAAHESAGEMEEEQFAPASSRQGRQTPGRTTRAGSEKSKSSTARTATSRAGATKANNKSRTGAKSSSGTTGAKSRATTKSRTTR